MRNTFITLANYMLRGNFPVSLRFKKACGASCGRLLGKEWWISRNTRVHSPKDLRDLVKHSMMIFLMMDKRC